MFSSNTSQVSEDANYIESCFSTYLYTGNGSTQTITNGIDLAGKGGMTWIKNRPYGYDNCLFDTARGANKLLISNSTAAQASPTNMLNSFNSNGFTLGDDGYTGGAVNVSGSTYASWTFRKQPKFFDVVTYTGDGVAGRTIAHNLGSAPGCVIIKSTSDPFDWYVYHQSLGAGNFLNLNLTAAATASEAMFGPGNPAPSSTVITLGNSNATNGNGKTYVAHLFAHNAGGFGLSGTDNVISCGSYTGNGSSTGPVIDLGYEPQWLMIKNASNVKDWIIFDSMRGFTVAGQNDPYLFANSSQAENPLSLVYPTATGFGLDTTSTTLNTNGDIYIYIAIRRGPMKTPTSGTSVFVPVLANNALGTQNTTGFPVDAQIYTYPSGAYFKGVVDRLRGVSTDTTSSGRFLQTNATNAEATSTTETRYWNNTGFQTPSGNAGAQFIYWNFRRAPGFFDEVCYTGTGSARTVAHNLGVAPELMIVKDRSSTQGWSVYAQPLGATNALVLQTTAAVDTGTSRWNSTAPTNTVFSLGSSSFVNASTQTFVAYLFASCPGVSKVGSYTGTGTTQQINCGFTAGARFVLIKRTDSTGDWYVWDSARGIVAGNDPYLLLNTTAAEVTTTDYVDTFSSGFEISSTAPAAINASGGTFIYLAIA